MVYFVQPEINIIHKQDCARFFTDEDFNYDDNLIEQTVEGYDSCQRTENESEFARRERNRAIIEKAEYDFWFTPNSKVFHQKDCGIMLLAAQINGAHYFQTCISKGRRPCKRCKPREIVADDLRPADEPIAASPEAPLTKAEERAINRHRQAVTERSAVENNAHLSAEKKADLFTLTTSSYGFFAAKNYKCFHLRNCKKVSGLKNLEGFSTFDDACRAGYRPCKHCKPSNKHDIIISLPIYTAERSGESLEELGKVCQQNGLGYKVENGLFYVETSVGLWQLDVARSPYYLGHINLVKTPDNRTSFHRQPKMFLSPVDAIYYIKRHDESLKFVWNKTGYVPIDAADDINET